MKITVTIESWFTDVRVFDSAKDALAYLDELYPDRRFSHTERVREGVERVYKAEWFTDETILRVLVPTTKSSRQLQHGLALDLTH